MLEIELPTPSFLCLHLNIVILAIDVHYKELTARAAGVLFDAWNAQEPARELICKVDDIEPYESGNFYKRELPCILALLEKYSLKIDSIVVDGYVFLDNEARPGLGKHLFNALNGEVTVIGVAKTPFQGINDEHKVYRGQSKTPLYVTSTDDLTSAKQNLLSMHGDFRLPTLLKRVDQLCRANE